MNLFELTKASASLSVVGMGKNTGKTVTLNHLIQENYRAGRVLGLTSAGRDGETLDLLTRTEKPRIYAPTGTLVATAEETLPFCEAPLLVLCSTPFLTAMGRVVIGQVLTGGFIQLAGPTTVTQLQEVNRQLMEAGAQQVLIDGAMDRRSAAAPAISQGVILATGAALGGGMDQVVEKTRYQVSLFQLPPLENPKLAVEMKEWVSRGKWGFFNQKGEGKPLPLETSLGAGDVLRRFLEPDSRYLLVKGALTESVLKALIKAHRQNQSLILVVEDGVKLFVGPLLMGVARQKGIRVMVLNAGRLLAVTINPRSPRGPSFPSDSFLEKIQSALYPLPVFNVWQGGQTNFMG